MNSFMVSPVGIRLVQLFLSYGKAYAFSRNKTPQQFASVKIYTAKIYFGLSFIWLKSKEAKVTSESIMEKTPSILEKADSLFENGHYEECYKFLTNCAAMTLDQKDQEVQWRICRALYNMSIESKYDKETKKEFTMVAYNIISDELEKHGENYAVQKWYALLLDAKSAYGGMKERISQLENVKKHMDLAVIINPNDATTLHMLGEWCYQVTELPWHQRKIAETLFASPPRSTYEDALEYFLRAETAQPRFYSLNLLRLGNCYLKLDKEDQAKYYLKLAASYPAKSNDDHRANKEAAELLKRLK